MNLRHLPALLCLAVAIAASPALAAPAQIDGHGTLHRVEAAWTGKPAMPTLLHTMVLPDGTTTASVVPGTNDLFMDLDPALAVDPVRGNVVLAWSRDTGGGFAVFVSRFDASGWSAPLRALEDPSGEEIEPQIQVTPSLVHVVGHNGAAYRRVCLDPETLSTVFGPEPLSNGGAGITPGVDPATSPPPTDSHVFFTSTVLRPSETDPGRVVIWGVRDEPVPIDYVEALVLAPDSMDGNPAMAAPIEGSLTVTVSSDTQVWYTVFQDGSWTESASVALDANTTLSDLRTMLADMIRRSR